MPQLFSTVYMPSQRSA